MTFGTATARRPTPSRSRRRLINGTINGTRRRGSNGRRREDHRWSSSPRRGAPAGRAIGRPRCWANMMRDPNASDPASIAGNPMNAAFHDLKAADKDWRPLLLANGTSEKTGRRIITSQLKIEKDKFPDAIDFFDEVNVELNLSTALHNSARFTYLDAAGNIVLAPADSMGSKYTGIRPDRILDGGYFENFGAATAFDLLHALRASEFAGKKFRPVIIQISADPALETDDSRARYW